MTVKTTNVGIVKAIHVGSTPPTNINMLWRDTNLSIHKAYNSSTSEWEPLIYSTLIDNVTIKKDIDGKLYVDESALSTFVLADKSVTLQKMADVASSTVFYRKTAGTGSPEVQTLAQLKSDLGLSGINSGDQDLSIYALKSYTINTKPLNGNIVLTPGDIGSPAGSGSSTGTNTGDEDRSSILFKLEIENILGLNTGDQVAETVPVEDIDDNFNGENVEDVLKELNEKISDNKNTISLLLPAYSTVGDRINNSIEGINYPVGWSLVVGVSAVDLVITHNQNRRVADVTIWAVDGDQEQKLLNTASNNGLITPNLNSVRILSLATVVKPIKIYIVWG